MENVKTPLRILCLEDNPNDRQLAYRQLAADGLNCQFLHVETRKEFERALKQEKFDLILSDFALPDYDGVSALHAAKKNHPDTPFILVSGAVGEERAVECLKSGATDCVLKENLSRLGPVVRRALAEVDERQRRRLAEESLRVRTEELQALAGRLLASREEERISVSREIHDELGEALTAQKLGLSWIRNRLNAENKSPAQWQDVFDRINKLSSLADSTAKRVREICTELRPAILDDLGLVAAIEWQARQFQMRTNIECKINLKINLPGIGEEQATAAFRIFQEVLTNVARHSGASKVNVTLKTDGEKLVMLAKDNGKGIPANKIRGGGSLGILGMRERATLAGGKFVIESEHGKGTTVTVTMPLQQLEAK